MVRGRFCPGSLGDRHRHGPIAEAVGGWGQGGGGGLGTMARITTRLRVMADLIQGVGGGGYEQRILSSNFPP